MRRSKPIIFFVALIGLGLLINSAFALDGPVRGRWSPEQGIKIITGHIEIATRDTLLIEPGTNVQFRGNFNFTVNGTLLINGTENDPAVLTAIPAQAGTWGGIRFNGVSSSGSRLVGATIEYAYRAILMESGAGARITACLIRDCAWEGVKIDGSPATVSNCTIENVGSGGGSYPGIGVTNNCAPFILGNNIINCHNNGISSGSGCQPRIYDNTISNVSDDGIQIAAACSLRNNTIVNPGQKGIYLNSATGAVLWRNVIDHAGGPSGIHLHRAGNVSIYHTTILNNSTGIFIFGSDNVRLTNNIVAYNGYGVDVQQSGLTLLYNDFVGNETAHYRGVDAGVTDISVDPMLDGNYTPVENSPVIDAGDDALPDDPDGTVPDIGAKFFNQNVPPFIVSFEPQGLHRVEGDTSLTFIVEVTDENGHPIRYYWFLNGIQFAQGQPRTSHFFDTNGDYEVKVVVDDGHYLGSVEVRWHFTIFGATSVKNETIHPDEFKLSTPYPNPFNGTVRFDVETAFQGHAAIFITDITGKRITDLWLGNLNPGLRSFAYNALNLPAGKYYLTLVSGKNIQVQPLILLK